MATAKVRPCWAPGPCDARASLGLRVQGVGFSVQGLGFRVQGSGFRVEGSGFRVQDLGFEHSGPHQEFQDCTGRDVPPGLKKP